MWPEWWGLLAEGLVGGGELGTLGELGELGELGAVVVGAGGLALEPLDAPLPVPAGADEEEGT